MTAPNQHEIIVEIGPFQEWQGKQGSGEIRIVSNGDINSMKVKVHIEKTIVAVPNAARISIWNLSQSTINAIRTAASEVKVYAGLQGHPKEYLYRGSLRATVTQRSGTDYITTLVCKTAESNLIRSIVSKTWTADVPVDQVVKEIVATIPNVIYDPQNKEIRGKIGYKGFSYVGTAMDALKKLANQYGFSWNINNGVFVAKMDGEPKKTGILLNSKGGLRKVSPRLSGIMQIQQGVDIYSDYRQNVEPGHLIRVESTVNPELNGNYDVHTVEYDLSPKDSEWSMSISTFIFQGAMQ